MKGKFTFLGTGASLGVPMIGCGCEVCCSTSHFNNRLRTSALVQIGRKSFLIDSGPDFRYQALRGGIEHLSGVLYTHSHHDHTAGIDDLRPFHFMTDSPIPLLGLQETIEDIKKRFYFLFKPTLDGNTARLKEFFLPERKGKVIFQDVEISYYTYYQDNMPVNAFRFGDLAYVSDIKDYQSDIFDWLKGVKTVVVSALRYTPSLIHLSVDEAVDFVNRSGAARGWLTHTSHDLEYEKTNACLPSHVQLAYDGLELEFEEGT